MYSLPGHDLTLRQQRGNPARTEDFEICSCSTISVFERERASAGRHGSDENLVLVSLPWTSTSGAYTSLSDMP